MATATIPFSNPAGKNQTTPAPIAKGSTTALPSGSIPGSPTVPGTPVSQTNPYVPPTAVAQPYNPGATGVQSSQQGFITSGTDAGQNALQKQLNDIYGQGVGDSLFSLLNGMSGTDSQILQEYIASLQPQMAKAQANTNAALGAGGVSANSSVAALADANLQSNEFASIASESAALTQNQEQMTAQILTGMEGASAKEVATSNWSIFGDVMNNITGDVGHILEGFNIGHRSNIPGAGGGGGAFGNTSESVLNSAVDSEMSGTGIDTTTDPAMYNPPQIGA